MSIDGQRIKWRTNIAENFNRLSTGCTNVTNDRRTGDNIYSDVNVSSRSLKMKIDKRYHPS